MALTAEKLNKALAELKQNLIAKGEATDIFGVERTKDSMCWHYWKCHAIFWWGRTLS